MLILSCLAFVLVAVSVKFLNFNHVPAVGYSIVASENPSTARMPLVVVLHGSGGNGDEFRTVSGFDNLARDFGFIAVFPSGSDGSWDAGNCCSSEKKDDVSMIKNIINNVKLQYKVDDSRVFVVGFSNGGMMAYRVACELSDVVTGVGSVSGTLGIQDCNPLYPVSVFHAHGVDDTIVPFHGGKGDADGDVVFSSVDSTIDVFKERQDCKISTSNMWDCKNETAVELEVKNGSHGWFENIEGEMYSFLYSHPRTIV